MDYLKLKGMDEFGDSSLTDQLRSNLIEFFNWGLLQTGAFSNINIGVTNPYGGDKSRLTPVLDDKDYLPGKVWQAKRADWVWEKNLDYHTQPVTPSGVTINNTFYPSDVTGAYAHRINYPLGQVIFDSPIPTSAIVQVEYSSRYFHFITSDVPWFREILFMSNRPDITQTSSPLAANRVQLPAVIVEVVPRRGLVPLMIGGGHWVRQDVLFHIFAQESWERDKLVDIITYQKEKTILSFDKNLITASDAFPLDRHGSLRPGAKMYPELVAPTGGFFWKRIFFKDILSQETPSIPPLWRGVVRGTFEIDFPEL